MNLSSEEQAMLEGRHGPAMQKAMQILFGLGQIYDAAQMIPVGSVQIAGVSYDNLGEAGLGFLTQMADGGGKVKVLTTLNPAGMDTENWAALGISEEFATSQQRVLDAFTRMGVVTTCTCTPYLVGSLPHFGEHIAWAESSAVCFANSVLGARTNREGGPGALAAALTGVTPCYGMHLTENRLPTLTVNVEVSVRGTNWFGAMGKCIGEKLEALRIPPVPYIRGIESASLEELKSLCASLATYGSCALFHMEGITTEAALYNPPEMTITITSDDLQTSLDQLNDVDSEIDFVTLGCPHLSLAEIQRIAELLNGKQVKKEFWITTSRPVKRISDSMGYTKMIEDSGAKIATDTCCVVAPIQGRFHAVATDSAKSCYYAYAKHKLKTRLLPFDEVIQEALR